MQLDFLFSPVRQGDRGQDVLRIGTQEVPIHFVRNRKARRYILRIRPDGAVRATIPRVGSIKDARAFAERSRGWIQRQLEKRREQPPPPTTWQHGTEILYHGEKVQLIVSSNHDGHLVRFADQAVPVANPANLRPAVERHLRRRVIAELTTRTLALARVHGLPVKRVTIRNQRSRWGSCSRHGTISLNWRLVQMADFVRDYIIIHELMHLREMNHGHRFWRLVEDACLHYREAKTWIRKHRGMLR